MTLKEIRNLDNMQEIDHDNFGRLVRLKTDIFDTVVYVDNNDDLYVLSDMQSGDWPTINVMKEEYADILQQGRNPY